MRTRLVVAKFYGAPAVQQLTTLLKQHISIAVDVIKAAKAGDKTAQQPADSKWQQNGVFHAVEHFSMHTGRS